MELSSASYTARENTVRAFMTFEVTRLTRQLTVRIYDLLPILPVEERYAMAQQLRRAAVSVGANIAEGAGRKTARDFAHFLSLSIGSLCELEYLLAIARDLNFIDQTLHGQFDISVQLLKKKLFRFREAVLRNGD